MFDFFFSTGFALTLFAIITLYKGIRIVSQSDVWIVERLGKFHKSLHGGLHFTIPFVDSIEEKLTLREQIIDIERQSVITKDNVNIAVDGIVFIRVQSPKDATYNVEDFKMAISNLAMTTLRSEIGQLALDETLSSRDKLNAVILEELDSASDAWGIKTMRVEISEISVPQEIEEAMNMQMKAEREKRAIELKAQADKEAVIRSAEAVKQQEVLNAEAIERMADAKKYEQEKVAEGQKNAIMMINESLKDNQLAGEFLLAKDRVKAFEELSKSSSKDKVIVPYEVTELIGSLSILTENLKKS
jgi:regulator of protease activity HflC (stomatin/prohibitin superfamily)